MGKIHYLDQARAKRNAGRLELVSNRPADDWMLEDTLKSNRRLLAENARLQHLLARREAWGRLFRAAMDIVKPNVRSQPND